MYNMYASIKDTSALTSHSHHGDGSFWVDGTIIPIVMACFDDCFVSFFKDKPHSKLRTMSAYKILITLI